MCAARRGSIVVVMTETLQDALPPEPPPPPPPSARRLARRPDDKVVAGVCAAAGRYTDTDPVLWRVLFAALALFGGAGVALYVLAWLLIPRADQPTSFVERQLRRPDRSVSIGGVLLLGVITVLVLGLADDGSGLLVLLVVGTLAFLVSRDRNAAVAGTPAAPATWTAAGEPSSYGVPPTGPPTYDVPPAWPGEPPVPPTPRPSSILGAVTVSAAALLTGLLLLLRELGVDGITGPRVVAAAMLVVGAGLLVGAWLGRARWLIAVGLALGLVLLPYAALDGRLTGGAGERTWVPTAAATDQPAYRLGAGEAVLDLRELEPPFDAPITAGVGLGQLVVLVPDDLRVRVTTEVGVGEVVERSADLDGRLRGQRQRAEDSVFVVGPRSGPALELDLEVGMGQIEVRRGQA
jgi:phage shock protein PspC (stress-responsive transcriptional regulator)